MKSLQQTAHEAIESVEKPNAEAENVNLPGLSNGVPTDSASIRVDAEGCEVTENEDGTVNLSFVISVDPKVQAEKAKAMPKGVKRTDLVDDISADDISGDDGDDSPWADDAGETEALDAAPRGVFGSAMDSLEETVVCRALVPLFCRNHGVKEFADWDRTTDESAWRTVKACPTVVGNGQPVVPDLPLKQMRSVVMEKARQSFERQANFAGYTPENQPQILLDGKLYRLTKGVATHGLRARDYFANGNAAALIGDLLNQSVRVPNVEGGLEFRIGVIDIGKKYFALLTSFQSQSYSDFSLLWDVEVLHAVNTKKNEENSNSGLHTAQSPHCPDIISQLMSAWQSLFLPGIKSRVHSHNQATALDAAPRGVFATALDELDLGTAPSRLRGGIALDARPSLHSFSPLENCRAKDPRFCPYHGEMAIKVDLESHLKSKGLLSNGETLVVYKLANGDIEIGVGNCPSLYMLQTAKEIGNYIDGTHGFSAKRQSTLSGMIVSRTYPNAIIGQYGGQTVKSSPHELLNEWVDELLIDLSDPKNQKYVEPYEVAGLLSKMKDIDDQVAAGSATGASYDQAVKDAQDAYLEIRAQIDEGDAVNSPADATQFLNTVKNDIQNRVSPIYHNAKAEVDAVKKAMFPGGKLPMGFAKKNQFAADYNKASSSLGYWLPKDIEVDETNLTGAVGQLAVGQQSYSIGELKPTRVAVASLRHHYDQYCDAVKDFPAAALKFRQALYDWAVANGNPNFNAAFPNGRPQNIVASTPPTPQTATPANSPIPTPQPSPAPANATVASPSAKPTTQTVQDRYASMTDAEADAVLAAAFEKVYDFKKNIPYPWSTPRKRVFAECSQKESTNAKRFFAAVLEDMKERFPSSSMNRLAASFTPALSSGARGRVVEFSGFGNAFRILSWKMRDKKAHARDDKMAGRKPPFSVSTSMSFDERDESTCRHEMAHVAFADSTLRKKFMSAFNAALARDPQWRDSVSTYAHKNNDECHSECVALAMSRSYRKGTLPPEIEQYVFRELLGVNP